MLLRLFFLNQTKTESDEITIFDVMILFDDNG